MAVVIGVKSNGKSQLITDTNEDTIPGETYRTTLEVSGQTNDMVTLLEQFAKIKNKYPAVTITYIEVGTGKIIIEFYDHPVVPVALVVAAIIAAIVVVGLVVVKQTVELVAPLFGNPVAATGLGLVLVAIGVGGTGYALYRYFGVGKEDYRRAGKAVAGGARRAYAAVRRRL